MLKLCLRASVFNNGLLMVASRNVSAKQQPLFSTTTLARQFSEESSGSSSGSGSSIDEREMKQFRAMSQSWWIEDGEFEALHRMNKLRVPMIKDTLINYRQSLPKEQREELNTCAIETEEEEEEGPSGQITRLYSEEELRLEPLLGLNILDVGCGGGILTEPLARLGAQVTAIDACKENIVVAQMRAEAQFEKSKGNLEFYERIRYFNCSLEDLIAVDENFDYFDGVVMSEVVEHVTQVDSFLRDSTKLLKNHGYAFVTTINRTPLSYLAAILGAEYLTNLVPRGTHTWEKFVTPNEIKTTFEQHKVFTKFEMGMCYNPVTRNWSWTNNKDVNYALYAQKFTN